VSWFSVPHPSAKQFIDGADIELWQRDRKIAKFDADE
jgi:hypothetical protein